MANFARGPRGENASHFWRLFLTWAVLSAIIDPIFYLLVGPHLPPGTMGSSAAADQFDANVIFVMAIPVAIAINLYLLYAVVVWRARPGTPEPSAAVSPRASFWVQTAWIAITSTIVTGLFLFGTVELIINQGSGGGEGPSPIWTPTSKTVLPVQVIAQQWKFTYRYPTFGGFETDQLVLPDDTSVAFHVTSLDVIHSFWAYQIGVKADANPGQDNVAFTTTQQLGTFSVRCNELCGIWHGAMFNYGHIVTKAAFMSWAQHEESTLAANTKLLPAFSWTYTPDANGAAGGYYPDNVDTYSKVEVYGATTVTPKAAVNPKA
jgi:cytochrome c oxidase subunit II